MLSLVNNSRMVARGAADQSGRTGRDECPAADVKDVSS
jgi:hypothetical protein